MTGWQWHQLDHMQIICISLQTDNHVSTSPLISAHCDFIFCAIQILLLTYLLTYLGPTQFFYRPDALPAAVQPTASKHCRQNKHKTESRFGCFVHCPTSKCKGPFLQPRGIHTPHIRPQWKPNPGDAYENPPSHGHSLFRCCRVQSINVQPTLHGILFLVITMSIIQHQFSQDVAFFYEKSIFNGHRSDSMAVSHI